jgi:hypothetical protein
VAWQLTCVRFSSLQFVLNTSFILSPLIDNSNIFGEEYKLWSPSICNFHHPPVLSLRPLLTGSNIVLSTFMSDTVSLQIPWNLCFFTFLHFIPSLANRGSESGVWEVFWFLGTSFPVSSCFYFQTHCRYNSLKKLQLLVACGKAQRRLNK